MPLARRLAALAGGLALLSSGSVGAASAAALRRAPATGGRMETLSGMVGAHRLTLRAATVAGDADLPVRGGRADWLAITELHGAALRPAPMHYLASAPGIAPCERRMAARGFGPITWFLPTGGVAVRSLHIRSLGDAAAPARIVSVRAVSRADLGRVRAGDRFTLMGTVINPWIGTAEEDQAAALAARLPVAPDRGVGRAFSCEIYYAAHDEAAVRAELTLARERARRYGIRALLGFVSWWNGTPRGVPDGQGGRFDDLRYQQVCYTPGAEHAENPELRRLLGPRYTRHYRLSTPNVWSNTPWLTMNSAALNAYRAGRLAMAARLLRDVSAGDTSWVAGVFLENEPRYWDTQSTEGTPQWAGEQWADFNPMVVEQAAREGITLDPADGLSPAELQWFQTNAGRYFQQTADAANRALAAAGLRGRFPVYTHSLQLASLFPGRSMNGSPADWARAAGARTGIEGMWSNLSDYDRIREWGPWCNLNREESDGVHIDTHLWDLRVTWAAGGELFNSYNWHILKDEAYFRYAAAFLAGLPSVELPPASIRRLAPDALEIGAPMGLQAWSVIAAPVAVAGGARPSRVALELVGEGGSAWFSLRIPLPAAGAALFPFPAPAETHWARRAQLRLHAYDLAGQELPGGAAFSPGAEASLRLRLDLDEQRDRSRLVIQWRQARVR